MRAIYWVFGAEGHRQRESFNPSYSFTDLMGCAYEVRNSDITCSHEYTELVITGESIDMITESLEGQISDGIFENSRVGEVDLKKIFK